MSETDAGDDYGLVGRVLDDRYRIETFLGQGGMASVYVATDERLSRRVVVKVPRLALISDDSMRRRFLAEIRDHSRLEHPHILTLIDQGLYEDVPYCVLQYLGGGDLAARLRAAGGRCAAHDVFAWLGPIARALDFIHESGSLHRDVKPGNILFDERDHPYLSDFGIATALDVIDAEAPTVAQQDRLTGVGHFVGSPAYAPPEAIDRLFTPAYDQYALATVVYLSLTGALPFEGKTNEAILIAKTQSDPASLRGALDDRDAAVAPVIERALSREPGERYPSCSAFAEAFETAARPESDGLRLPRIPIAAAAALALLLIAWLWMGTKPWGSLAANDTISASAPFQPVLLGSTAAEIEAALALCRRHAGRCDPDEFVGETPRSFSPTGSTLDRHEVTITDFADFAADDGLVTAAERAGYSWDGPTRRYGASFRVPSGEDGEVDGTLPAVHVTFEEAAAYCAARGKRLPTADEWEWAARGADRRIFPWGDDWETERVRPLDRGGLRARAGRLASDGRDPRRADRHGGQRMGVDVQPRRQRAGLEGRLLGQHEPGVLPRGRHQLRGADQHRFGRRVPLRDRSAALRTRG